MVYDTHELETEALEVTGLRKVFSKFLERVSIHYVDCTIVVSDSIAEWYRKQYALLHVDVIRNFPYTIKSDNYNSRTLKEKFKIENDETLYIYQGGLSRGRSIETILKVFSKTDTRKHLVMMGYGDLEDTIKGYEQTYTNIHFQPAVQPQEVLYYTASADVGISLTENNCLSHHYSLPNKMFEYLAVGLPVIISDFPEMSKIIYEYNCGWKIQPQERALIELIENISINDILEKKVNVTKCKDKFTWENEEKTLFEVYGDLFQNQT